MLSDAYRPMLAEGEPDPATPELRVALARALLKGAIRRYQEASTAWTEVHESYPNLDHARHALEATEATERKGWKRILIQADDEFNSAELALASRIENLYDMLAPEGRRAADAPSKYFVPRAVRSGGAIYVLTYSVGHYEPETNIIVVYPEDMVIDLQEPVRSEINANVA